MIADVNYVLVVKPSSLPSEYHWVDRSTSLSCWWGSLWNDTTFSHHNYAIWKLVSPYTATSALQPIKASSNPLNQSHCVYSSWIGNTVTVDLVPVFWYPLKMIDMENRLPHRSEMYDIKRGKILFSNHAPPLKILANRRKRNVWRTFYMANVLCVCFFHLNKYIFI